MNSGTYWEPWQPQEGDRVLIRINPECRGYRSAIAMWDVPGDPAEEVWIEHRPDDAGMTGVVSTIWADDWLEDGHRFYVAIDPACRQSGRFIRVAAGEIELIERVAR
jgi:hypothetical protein